MPLSDWDYKKLKLNVHGCKVPVVVEFYMPDCPRCRQTEQILEIIETDYKNRAVFGKCRLDEYVQSGGEFPVSFAPTVCITNSVVNKQGQLESGRVFHSFQEVTEQEIRDKLDKAIEETENSSYD